MQQLLDKHVSISHLLYVSNHERSELFFLHGPSAVDDWRVASYGEICFFDAYHDGEQRVGHDVHEFAFDHDELEYVFSFDRGGSFVCCEPFQLDGVSLCSFCSISDRIIYQKPFCSPFVFFFEPP